LIKQRRITIRMAVDLYENLIRYSVGQGMTLSQAVRELIKIHGR